MSTFFLPRKTNNSSSLKSTKTNIQCQDIQCVQTMDSSGEGKQSQPLHPNPLVNEFLDTLNPMEKKAYYIAKSHLGTTFNIEKANAFLRWKKERNC